MFPIAVVVCFNETSYSVTERGEVTVGISANRDFTSSFTVTVVHPDPGLFMCVSMQFVVSYTLLFLMSKTFADLGFY